LPGSDQVKGPWDGWNQLTPTRNGQIIMTTQESNVLDIDLFRQDKIWLAEKDQKGESHFNPLSDFNIRPDLDVRRDTFQAGLGLFHY